MLLWLLLVTALLAQDGLGLAPAAGRHDSQANRSLAADFEALHSTALIPRVDASNLSEAKALLGRNEAVIITGADIFSQAGIHDVDTGESGEDFEAHMMRYLEALVMSHWGKERRDKYNSGAPLDNSKCCRGTYFGAGRASSAEVQALSRELWKEI